MWTLMVVVTTAWKWNKTLKGLDLLSATRAYSFILCAKGLQPLVSPIQVSSSWCCEARAAQSQFGKHHQTSKSSRQVLTTCPGYHNFSAWGKQTRKLRGSIILSRSHPWEVRAKLQGVNSHLCRSAPHTSFAGRETSGGKEQDTWSFIPQTSGSQCARESLRLVTEILRS